MNTNKILALTLGICLLDASPAFADTVSDAKLEKAIEKLMAQSNELQAEVRQLKAELKQVKSQQHKGNAKTAPSPMLASSSTTAPTPTASPNSTTPAATGGIPEQHPHPNRQLIRPVVTSAGAPIDETDYGIVTTQGVALNEKGEPILTVQEEISQERDADLTYLMGSYVLTSQVLSIQSRYDASDLLVNLSTMNEDLRFLQQRQALEDIIGFENLPSASRPRLFISGKVEALGDYIDPFVGTAISDIAVNGAELDALAEVSPWGYGFMSFNYDSSPLSPLLIGSGNPVNNSRVFMNRAFLTIGNLDSSPIYFTAGQLYPPFGRYVAYQLSNPVTKIEGRMNTRAAVLGYFKDGLYVSGYALDGAVSVDGSNTVDEFGGNAGYKYSSANGFLNYQFGMGVVNDIAEAQGYQLTGSPSGFFQGFSQSPATENLQHYVPGFDAHASIALGPISFYSEYVTATESFAWQDLTYNNSGAKPSAGHIEGDYTFKLFNKPSSFTLAYEHTWQSLPLNVPQNSYIGAFNISIWKNTIESLEYRHDTNYSSSDTGGGICDPGNTGVATFCSFNSTGGEQNSVLAQIGVYF